MTANPIHYLKNLGLIVTLDNNQIIIKPTQLVTKEIVAYIKQHKDAIKNGLLASSYNVRKVSKITELSPPQKRWLYQVARYLNISPDDLLQYQLIDQFDLVELLDKEPAIVADAVKVSCYWIKKATLTR